MKGTYARSEKKKRWPLLLGLAVLVAVLILLLTQCNGIFGKQPVLTVQSPQKLSIAGNKEFTLDVTISDLGDTLYPAMSVSILFDPSRLEFLGVEEGNVFVYDSESAAAIRQKLPDWSCNPTQCNNSGLINVMYLDMTGGKNAFSRDLLAEEDNVVMRLSFRLRGSVRKGDVLNLEVQDAVFAASEEKESLAMTSKTLKARNGRIVIGE